MPYSPSIQSANSDREMAPDAALVQTRPVPRGSGLQAQDILTMRQRYAGCEHRGRADQLVEGDSTMIGPLEIFAGYVRSD